MRFNPGSDTVADRLAALDAWVRHIDGETSSYATDEWKARGKLRVLRIRDRLERFPPAMELLSLREAIFDDHDFIGPQERFIFTWQHRERLALSPYEDHRIQLIAAADEGNLEQLRELWPDDVAAIRRWRDEPGFADSVRGLPIAFSV